MAVVTKAGGPPSVSSCTIRATCRKQESAEVSYSQGRRHLGYAVLGQRTDASGIAVYLQPLQNVLEAPGNYDGSARYQFPVYALVTNTSVGTVK
jgi:hypothetical protein